MRLTTPLLIIGIAIGAAPLAADEMHSHPVPEKLGTVAFATTCAPNVAGDFQRAVALLHSFAYSAAEDAFEKVAAADPTCAMAHWGVAMTYYHPLWSPPNATDLSKGQSAIAKAVEINARSERERQYISAAAAFYHDFDHLPHAARAKAYEEGMEVAARSNPTDTETQVFYALSLIATAPPEDRTHSNQKRAADILEPIYRTHPDHPGVAHYLIHAYDSTELAPKGLAAARAYSKIAPSAPHALHMPSHIFTRLGLWRDSIESNNAARKAAHEQGDLGEELHAMDYLAYAYLQLGRTDQAQRVADALSAMSGLSGPDFKVGYAATAMPVRINMENKNWDAAAKLQPLPDTPPHVAATVYWGRAVANSRAGRPQAADEDIKRLGECQQKLLNAGNAYWAKQVAILGDEAVAWQLAASSRTEEAIQKMTQAADEEDAVEKLPVTPGPIIPAREQLGQMLDGVNRPKEALEAYQAALVSAPGRRGALVGAAHAADLIGDRQTASRMRARMAS